jgi:hypothetical protein
MKATVFGRSKSGMAAVLACIILMCVPGTVAHALDMDGVIAYPVPYNPEKLPLTIEDRKGTLVASVKVEVFDINGDTVYRKGHSTFGKIYWGGRNSSGRMVKPGLYIIKITAESETGDYGTKILRILVNY